MILENSLYTQVLLLLSLAVGIVFLARRFNLAPLIGYLLIGILVGPHALGVITDGPVIHLAAEIGLAFLLFMIGLEFSLPRLWAMRKLALGLGGTQVLISTLSGGAIAWMMGLSWEAALITGGALALSSTAIGFRQLTEQVELHLTHGRLALAVLLFQDLAVIPLLTIVPILSISGEANLILPVLNALAIVVVVLLGLITAGHWILRPLFRTVAHVSSSELFTLTTLFAALSAAWVTYSLGLPMELGAFLAGIMLGETEYRHQVEADVRPFRDVLMGLFFISVGMQLDILSLSEYILWLLLLVPGLIFGKGLVITALTYMAGYSGSTALRTGIVLGQGSEFSFAILLLAIQHGLISAEKAHPVIAAVLISMLISPLLIHQNRRIASLLPSGPQTPPADDAEKIERLTGTFRDHVILCGFGHVGQNLASFLSEGHFAFVALERDSTLAREGWEAGEKVFYGDGTSLALLRSAGLDRCAVLVITFDDAESAERIIRMVRHEQPELPIIARLSDDRSFEMLHKAGATDIVPEYVEAGTTLATHVLGHLGLRSDRMLKLVEEIRRNQYRKLRGHFMRASEKDQDVTGWRLRTMLLVPGCSAIGKKICDLKPGPNVYVRAVRRGNARDESPDPDMQLEEGDALILQGPGKDLEHAERRLTYGGES